MRVEIFVIPESTGRPFKSKITPEDQSLLLKWLNNQYYIYSAFTNTAGEHDHAEKSTDGSMD